MTLVLKLLKHQEGLIKYMIYNIDTKLIMMISQGLVSKVSIYFPLILGFILLSHLEGNLQFEGKMKVKEV